VSFLASLSTQSLNQFSESMALADALSAEIAGIYGKSKGSVTSGEKSITPPSSGRKSFKAQGQPRSHTSLPVFEQ
jgi:hypothetical protein